MRLSKEDEWSRDESNSIRMQRILLREYVASHFEAYRLFEFMDDGFSGTHFNRPGVLALLEQARASELDCIVVKDFSRFSRDYIELGAYIDQIFPFMRIRFISINDGYDSVARPGGAGGLDVSFKNLLYDLYSKDLSVKVKSSLAARKEKGQYVCGNCPFGYQKAPQDRHRLIIAEEEAAIVRRIFAMAAEGETSVEIARAFNREGVKTPADFQRERGRRVREPKGGRFAWSAASICGILRNEAYAGDMVYHKYTKETVGGGSSLRPREEWKVFRDHHEPVIDRETFGLVQRSRGKKRPPSCHTKHPLTGKLVCAACGRSLQIRRGRNPYFLCPNLYTEERDGCIRKANALFLEQVVLYEIQQKLQTMPAMEGMAQALEEKRRSCLRELARKEAAALEGLRTCQRRQEEAYERYTENAGKDPGRKKEEAAVYRETGRRLEAEREKLRAELDARRKEMREQSCAPLSEACPRELTEEAVSGLIDKIVVQKRGEQEPEALYGESISVEILWR